MAYVNAQFCMRCGQQTQHINDRCLPCSSRQRQEEDAKWQALTVDEKLDWIRGQLLAGRNSKGFV